MCVCVWGGSVWRCVEQRDKVYVGGECGEMWGAEIK